MNRRPTIAELEEILNKAPDNVGVRIQTDGSIRAFDKTTQVDLPINEDLTCSTISIVRIAELFYPVRIAELFYPVIITQMADQISESKASELLGMPIERYREMRAQIVKSVTNLIESLPSLLISLLEGTKGPQES